MAYIVHALHILAMAVILGGSVAASFGSVDRRYEWTFWGAIGVIVATGIGNVAAWGDTPPLLSWTGAALLLKLVLVMALLGVSVRRGMRIVQGKGPGRLYHVTAGLVVVIASLGVSLAH